MNTNDLRKRIEKAILKEGRTNKFKNLLLKQFTNTEADITIEFIKGYIRQVPDIMDLVYSTASKAGVLSLFQPVFDSVFIYWEEKDDVIPDDQGILGFSDDAYLSLCLMQKIAESKTTGSNNKLIKLDLKKDNNTMRTLLGNQIATMLEKMVENVFASVQFQIYLGTLLNNPLMGTGLQGFNIQQMNSMNPKYFQYQQRMRDLDNLYQMKHDVFMGDLGSMAANAGISWP